MANVASSDKKVRLNFYMNSDLVEVIDEYAKSLGVSRASAINIICSLWKDSRDMQCSLKDIANFSGFVNLNKDN